MSEYDLVAHLKRQRAFSLATFGPGRRTDGVLDHIAKELDEVRRAPTDLTEWVDLVLLALDGAWRAGYTAEQIAAAIEAKQTRNEDRTWPDWRTADPTKAIEHVRRDEPTWPWLVHISTGRSWPVRARTEDEARERATAFLVERGLGDTVTKVEPDR